MATFDSKMFKIKKSYTLCKKLHFLSLDQNLRLFPRKYVTAKMSIGTCFLINWVSEIQIPKKKNCNYKI